MVVQSPSAELQSSQEMPTCTSPSSPRPSSLESLNSSTVSVSAGLPQSMHDVNRGPPQVIGHTVTPHGVRPPAVRSSLAGLGGTGPPTGDSALAEAALDEMLEAPQPAGVGARSSMGLVGPVPDAGECLLHHLELSADALEQVCEVCCGQRAPAVRVGSPQLADALTYLGNELCGHAGHRCRTGMGAPGGGGSWARAGSHNNGQGGAMVALFDHIKSWSWRQPSCGASPAASDLTSRELCEMLAVAPDRGYPPWSLPSAVMSPTELDGPGRHDVSRVVLRSGPTGSGAR